MTRALLLLVVVAAAGCELDPHPFGAPCDAGCQDGYTCDPDEARCVPGTDAGSAPDGG